tara:strand:- start:42 stop:638 length:597 start_codon:yes stop_codon:yes gene_type:complete
MSAFSFNSIPTSEPSLFIKKVFPNKADPAFIAKVLQDELRLGKIERVDVVPTRMMTRDDEPFMKVFIHFQEWSNSEEASEMRKNLLEEKEYNVVYDERSGRYWQISASKVSKPRSLSRGDKPRPRIELNTTKKQVRKPTFEESRAAYQKKFEEERARDIAENGEPCPGCESGVDSSAAHCDEDGSYPHPNCCSAPGCE